MAQKRSQSAKGVNFDDYRKEYESNEHWTLRKSFMKYHWDRVNDEEEMLCCAQLFVNTEFLGCRYAPEIMTKIKLMSDEVPEITKHRESRKDKLKRTFVTAKDAIQAKYSKKDPATSSYEAINFQRPAKIRKIEEDVNDSNNKDRMEWEKYVQDSTADLNFKNPTIRLTESQKLKNLRALLKDVIVFESGEENDLNYCLNKTTACMRKIGKLDITYDADNSNYLYIFNGQIIAEGKGETKKLAKKAADENFIATLRDNCYTIRSKLKFYSGTDVIKRDATNKSNTVSQNTNQIQQDNLGFKLLSKLGWKGGSLGTNGTGIIDPINLEIKIGKKGLGSELDSFNAKYFRNLLHNFKNNDVEYDLIFSPEFSKEERAQIHQIAAQMNLRTKSYGKSDSRHLVISTRISPQVLRQKLIEGDEHLKEKYELLSPPFVKVVQD